MRDILCGNLGDMGKRQFVSLKLAQHVRERAQRIRIAHIVKNARRRETNPDPVASPDAGDRLDNLQREPGTVLHRTTVAVGTLVGAVTQELIEQIAVGVVDLDSVKTGLFCQTRP